MNRLITAATLLALSGAWTAANAENESGFYVGGGVGQFNVQIDDIDDTDEAIERLDDDDTSWKAFVGYRFNPYLSLEAAYIDFGGPSDSIDASGSSGDYKVEASGFAPYVIGTLPLGPVELFAKVGYYFYDVDLSVDLDDLGGDVFRSSSSEEDLLYGAGVGMTFFEHLHARLEYEKIDSDVLDDADAIWLSGAWRF
ncbi:MAG TPA: porin family protein [Povalibacter sp.]|uniref:porin family protein n=1 Tax=Povalibacter sp. TaxID=1962978 RepID=UPI002BA5FCD3|nr:porin family protein [Povalibacter sp.]HMN44983.1 porin family protein [Povalibacter sp.]